MSPTRSGGAGRSRSASPSSPGPRSSPPWPGAPGCCSGRRAAQGVGAAVLSPAAMALLVGRFPEGPSRTRALAIWSSVGAAAASTGVLAGGVLAELLGWRSIFLANVPLGLAALAAVPALPAVARTSVRPSLRAALLATAALVALVHALGRVGDGELLEPSLAAAAGLALGACFVRRERRAAQPLVPRAVLGSRVRAAALAVGFVHGGMMLGTYLLLPLVMQQALGYSPIEAGLGLLALRGSSIGWARVARRGIDVLGAPRVVGIGAAAMIVGQLLLLRVDATSGYAGGLLPALVVLGLAIPCLFVGVSVLALEGVPGEHAGAASGLLTAAQWSGGAVGLALVTAAAAAGAGPLADAAASFHAGVAACAGLGAVGLALAVALVAVHRRATAVSPTTA
ncbi:MAG: MFS transporter [Thermoleophilia bacterium]